ncbi:AraC-type DNA-binding protein [Alteromonadaceae bacterium Bs31]|nr:AraC-type DNA-binding protein [Alteromonadaceae bacterium Bs31]
MFAFYKKVTLYFAGMSLLTLMLGFLCLSLFTSSKALLPLEESIIPWQVETINDEPSGGASAIREVKPSEPFSYQYFVSDQTRYPHVRLALNFGSTMEPQLVDLRNMGISFEVKCEFSDVLTFELYTLDKKISEAQGSDLYRPAADHFLCEQQWTTKTFNFEELLVPLWWLDIWKVDSTEKTMFDTSKARSLVFVSSRHKSMNQWTKVEIRKLEFIKQNRVFIYLFCAISLFMWLAFIRWVLVQYVERLKEDIRARIDSGKALIAYQKLSVEPHKDKERSTVLQFLAKEFSNPDINMEMLSKSVGINRTKINEILKDELGVTFSSYLNKLRTTEAARLLREEPDAIVSEIAFSVGYKNVTHFNKVFKSEYGCSPRTFKEHRESL